MERGYSNMLTMQEHLDFQFLDSCPVCGRQYNKHWKVVNHIRKTKDSIHVDFLQYQEKQFFDTYQCTHRQKLHNELFNQKNIFCGTSFAHSSKIIHKFVPKDQRLVNRIERISGTLTDIPKTDEHNRKVSESVSKAWKDGIFDTPKNKEAHRKGIEGRKSFAGENNPMYGKPCPKGAGRGKGGIRQDIGHYVRSTWEANICRVYNFVSRAYEYEKYRFKVVLDGIKYTYCPDIYDPKTKVYYEIKGHARSAKLWVCECVHCVKNKKLITELKKNGLNLRIIGKYEYNRFKRKFSKRIPEWEK